MKEFNPRALLEHLVVGGKKNCLLLRAVCRALKEKFRCLSSVVRFGWKGFEDEAATLNNEMGEGGFELPLYCLFKKKRGGPKTNVPKYLYMQVLNLGVGLTWMSLVVSVLFYV